MSLTLNPKQLGYKNLNINGAYEWGAISITIPGYSTKRLEGVTGITFGADRAVTINKGADYSAWSKSYGQINYDATLSIYGSQLDDIIESVKYATINNEEAISPFNIGNFDIIVEWIDSQTGGKRIKTLRNCEFSSYSYEFQVGNDSETPMQIPLNPTYISNGRKDAR